METPIDIDRFVNFTLLEFQKAHGYSEVPMEKMRESIRKFLITDYNQSVMELEAQLQYEQAHQFPINRDYYQNELGKIRARLLMKYEEMKWMGN